MTPEAEMIDIDTIEREQTTQARASLNEAALSDYQEFLMSDSANQLPPILLFYCRDSGGYYIGDGWHRFFAYELQAREKIPATVHAGSERKALIYALGANEDHGARRTPEDKRNAVTIALSDDEFVGWSDREVAELCSVSRGLVGAVRKELEAEGAIDAARPATASSNSKRQETRAAIEEALAATPDASDREIAKAVGCDHKTVGAARAQVGKSGKKATSPHPPEEADQAAANGKPVSKPEASGAEVVPTKKKREAKLGWGKVVRLITDLDLNDELGDAANLISRRLGDFWGSGR